MKKIDTIYEYFNNISNDKKISINSSLEKSIETQLSELLPSLSTNKTIEFSKAVTDIATSNEVLNSLSDRLGTPKEKETEDAFVKRGKSILADLIRKKLTKNSQ